MPAWLQVIGSKAAVLNLSFEFTIKGATPICRKMAGCSNYLLAKRAFISILLSLARAYHLIVDVNRDSSDTQVQKAYRRVLLKVHPDKGGRKADAQRLQEAREKWEAARAQPGQAGRPKKPKEAEPAEEETWVAAVCQGGGYRINSRAVLLTYQGFRSQAQGEPL